MIKKMTAVNLFLILLSTLAHAQNSGAPIEKCINGSVYRTCGDQQFQNYQNLITEVKSLRDTRILLIFGMESCPWCHSLNRYFSSDQGKALLSAKKLKLLEVGVFDLKGKASGSGYRILANTLFRSIETPKNVMKGQEGYPLIAVYDPNKLNTVLIHTADLELNTPTKNGHDFNKVKSAIDQSLGKLDVIN